MSKNYTFLFPGQGSQYKGMGKNILNSYAGSKKYYSTARDILNYDILDISINDPQDQLDQTKFTQPAIFINSVIKDQILKDNNIYPNAVSGHSLGEYSALVSSEVISYEDALRIIKIRSKEMQNAGESNNGGMLAVLGATKEQIDQICNKSKMLVPANYNSNDQIVLSGDSESIQNAVPLFKEIGIKRVIRLKTSGAFHSPLMKSARNSLTKVIKSIEFKDAKIPIYQNTYPLPETKAENIKLNLIKQLESPVYWNDTILNMEKNNLNIFIEVGPGQVLSKLNKKISDNSNIITFDTASINHESIN